MFGHNSAFRGTQFGTQSIRPVSPPGGLRRSPMVRLRTVLPQSGHSTGWGTSAQKSPVSVRKPSALPVRHSGRGEGSGVKCNIALLAAWGLDGIAVKDKRERCAHTDAPWPCHNVTRAARRSWPLSRREHQAKDTSRSPKERGRLLAVRARRGG